MTPDELAAIRARAAQTPLNASAEDLFHVAVDVPRLCDEVERAWADVDTLIAGLALVNSVPVVPNDERHGYDCKGCGGGSGGKHEADCPWERAMTILRARRVLSGEAP